MGEVGVRGFDWNCGLALGQRKGAATNGHALKGNKTTEPECPCRLVYPSYQQLSTLQSTKAHRSDTFARHA